MDTHDRPVVGFDLINVIDAPHRHLFGQIKSDLAEGPLEPGAVQEKVGAGIEA